MQIPSFMTVIALVAIGAQVLSIIGLRKLQRSAPELRSKGILQFRKSKVQSTQDRFSFLGETATIVQQHEFGPIRGILSKNIQYTLTIYARNDFGEYFVFKSSAEGGAAKHLSTSIARAILKDNYVARSTEV